jgi:hypothetical protein
MSRKRLSTKSAETAEGTVLTSKLDTTSKPDNGALDDKQLEGICGGAMSDHTPSYGW